MAARDFLDVPRRRARTSAGEVELPVVYRDGTAVSVFFRVDLLRAVAALGDAPVTAARLGGGVGLAAIGAYDYRDSSAGAYREVGLAVAAVPIGAVAPALPLLHLVHPRAPEEVGWYVVDLPVTSELADAAGRELWGLPKFVTDIAVEVNGPELSAVVQAPVGEAPILSLAGRRRPGLVLPAPDLVLWSLRGGALLRTRVEARGRMRTGSGHGLVLRIGSVDHPMARRLQDLGLDGARPIAAQVCESYRLLLHEGEPYDARAARAA